MAGIYIHIPFCKQRCRYCSFFSSTKKEEKERYVSALCRELQTRSGYADGEKIETIYIGGGTPSTLQEEHFEKIFSTITDTYTVASGAEITLEANPDDLTPEYLAMLHTQPFNRLSMGIQSFDDNLLRTLGRRHDSARAIEAFTNARSAGFDNISIDLMFALPGSTRESWQRDLDQAISLKPEHISAYNLTYEEDTPFFNALQKGNITPLSEEENIGQFEMLVDRLTAAGYRHYEISNFAQPGCESRHNSSYWHDIPYIGCGASAHSYNGKKRSWNVADIELYIKGIETENPDFEIEHLSENELYNDAIVTRLRTADGLPLEWFREKFNKKLYDYMCRNIVPHIASGTLQESNGCVSLTREGIFISDSIMRDLIYIE